MAPGGFLITFSFTLAVPSWIRAILRAALLDKSIFRPRRNGPQSLIRTVAERPFFRLVTTTREPSGKPFAAAVILEDEKRSPVAVR
jgi:hypothetical protein